MPRAGWLALGGLGAALLAGPLPLPAGALPLLLGATALVLLSGWIAAPGPRRAQVAAVAAGAALVLLRAAIPLAASPASLLTAAPTGSFAWTATVESVSAPSAGDQRAMVLATTEAGPGGEVRPAEPGAQGPYRLWAQLPRYPSIAPGDRITFRGRVEPISGDGGFRSYLDRLGAAGTIRGVGLTLGSPAGDPGTWLERLRRMVDGWIAAVLPEPQAGLATAIVIGLRDRVDRDVAAAFTSAGLSHVVAISGWNIALVGATIGAFLHAAPRRRRAIVTALAVAAYTLLAGASPSVLRAALMAAVVLLARELGRPGQARAALGLACLAMLLLDPGVVSDAGFQLSVAATAGLVGWGSGLAARLRRAAPSIVPDSLVEALAISLAAQAATLPIVVLQFSRLSLVSPAANLAAAPLVAPVMLAGILAALAGAILTAGLPGLLLVPVTVLGSLLVGALIALAEAAAALPFASLELPPPWPPVVAAASGVAILGLAHGGVRRTIGRSVGRRGPTTVSRPRRPGSPARPGRQRQLTAFAVMALAVALVPMGLGLSARPDGRLHVAVLDVGQGDAILLTGDRGGRMLIDTGPDPDRILRLLDARIPAWDRRLALLVLTHPHEDHVGGAALLLERYRVDAIAEPGMRGPGPGYAALSAVVAARSIPDRRLARGDRITLDGATMLVRWPVAGSVPSEAPDDGRAINDASIVIDLRFGARRVLLTGDAEDDVDPQLLADGLGTAPVDVLKVAHHGSRTATSAALLAALRPAVAIISVGAHNLYGHPAPETLARLEAVGARTYRTDRDGTVEVST
ncbi:MAG: ComEC/Rec2 family competence protein, partial [Candidatus Limnocylindrales bacterium]